MAPTRWNRAGRRARGSRSRASEAGGWPSSDVDLIRASTSLGGLATLAPGDHALIALERYASAIGLAFQIQDDILDVEGSTETLGKTQGADQALDKPTYPALLGLEESRRRADDLCEQAIAALDAFSTDAALLRELATFIVKRNR